MTPEVVLDAGSSTLAASTSGDGEPVVAVHGFAQNRDCLGPLAASLVESHRLTRVDAPGHGGSSMHGGASLWQGADLLVGTAGRGAYLGYSMGARLCLHAALAHPESVSALVLIGGTAGIDDATAREARRRSDLALATRLEQIGLDAFIREWLELEMFAGLPDWARFDDQRRSNDESGLADSLRHAGTGTMEPLWDRLAELRCPVLCLTGADDGRYGALAERLVERIGPAAEHVVVADAGHAAHLENVAASVDAVLAFLGDRRLRN